MDHKCFNTSCVNPAHLQLLTRSDNSKVHRPGCECHVCAPDCEHDRTAPGALRPGGQCRACNRERTRLRMRALRAERRLARAA